MDAESTGRPAPSPPLPADAVPAATEAPAPGQGPLRAAWASAAVVASLVAVKGSWDGVYLARTTEAVQTAARGQLLALAAATALLVLAIVGVAVLRRVLPSLLVAVPAVLVGAATVMLDESFVPTMVALVSLPVVLAASVLVLVPRR